MKRSIKCLFKRLACGAVAAATAATLVPIKALSQSEITRPTRHIIICIDGVGISTINKMRAEGRFKLFRPPSHMISTFPSLTNSAMSEILDPAGARMTAGYEDNFFDVSANKMRGGVIDRLRGDRFIRGTFRELFDYHPSAIKSGLGYAAPPVSTYLESLSDIIRLRQKARKSTDPVFFAYSGATDSLAHLGGEPMLRSFLKQLDESVEDIVRDSKVPVEVTIFSDHGNHFRKYRRVSLKAPLRRAGFRFEKKIKDGKSIVFPQYGLVGAAVLFTNEANESRVAGAVVPLKGVDFVAYEKDGMVFVLSRNGEATIERNGDQYRYRPVKGDPLELLSVGQQIAAVQTNGSDGFADDAEWFAATQDSVRPDALRRIFEGVTQGVQNRANVIVNFEDGYYTGSSLLDVFAVLQATHGNIGKEQSYGFVMSTSRELPHFIRAEYAWKVIGCPQLNRAKSTVCAD